MPTFGKRFGRKMYLKQFLTHDRNFADIKHLCVLYDIVACQFSKNIEVLCIIGPRKEQTHEIEIKLK